MVFVAAKNHGRISVQSIVRTVVNYPTDPDNVGKLVPGNLVTKKWIEASG